MFIEEMQECIEKYKILYENFLKDLHITKNCYTFAGGFYIYTIT